MVYDHISKTKLAIISLILMTLPVCLAQLRGIYAVVETITLRQQPEETSLITAQLNPNSYNNPPLIVNETHDGWIRLANGNGVTGWIKKSEKGLVAVPDLMDAEGNTPILVGFNGSKRPKLIHDPLKDLPKDLTQNYGKALFALVIEKDGSVGEKVLLVSSGIPQFDANSLQAIGNWRYEPPEISGRAISLLIITEISFGRFVDWIEESHPKKKDPSR